ncbi:MAG: hypothetical protein IJY27_02430 [Clostridia bacterium]|nr:hypothetical protein [Clostridia bacterium]
MKKILSIALVLVMLMSVAVMGVSAATPYEEVLLLGDSITYGYGLEGGRDNSASYGNLLRQYLDIPLLSFKNAAVNGDTSSDLLALLPSLEQDVKDADLIVVTIGGNDLLGLIWEAGAAVLGSAFSSYAQIIDIMNDPALLAQMTEQLTLSKISNAIVKYTTNLAAIVSFIRSNNSDAEVIFLAQYDPMYGVEGIEALSTLSGSAITMLNSSMKTQAELGGCTYLDIYTPFLGHAMEWTFILSADIHPNAEGHRQIFNILKEYLDGKNTDTTVSDTTTSSPVTTTTPAETTTTVPLETTPVSEVTTPAVTEPVTSPEEQTTPAQTSDVPAAVTTEPDVTEPDTSVSEPVTGGCGGSVAMLSLVAALTLGGAVISRKKK